MRTLLAFVLCVTATAQQALAPVIEIRGVVTEAVTNLPVPDAEITVDSLPNRPVPVSALSRIAKTTTDSQGTFRVALEKPGTYLVTVGKEGYTADGKNPARAPSNQHSVTLDKDHPSADARFRLSRCGELLGRVVDEATGRPIPNFHVYPINLLYSKGKAIQIGGKSTITDSEGRFVITGLQPGNYLVEIGPQALGKKQLLAQFTEQDLQAVDHDYRRSYWPGGGGLDLALPVQVLPGSATDMGTITARKVPYYRIHVSLPSGSCKEGERVLFDTEIRQFISGGAGGEGACGKDYLLRNYEPGSYQLYVMAGNAAENRMRAILPVDVIDKNLDLTVPLGRGVDIDGRVIVAENSAKPPIDKIRIHMWTTGPIQFVDEREPATPDAEGRFRFPNWPLLRVRVWISGLGSGFAVREFRYNGSPVTDNIFALNPNATQHTLQIMIDDKPASLTGTVADGDKPVARAHVALIRWPASLEDVFLSAKSVEGDEDGRFRYADLAPGEYRIMAVSPDEAEKLDEPHVLERFLSRAERVELTAGGSKRISLKLTNLSQ